jgi:RNA polymerase sigma-70 factor (ECF subfamily)
MGGRSCLDARQRDSFADAFAAEFPTIYRYLRRRAGSEVAEEVAAQTFATAYTNWDRYDQSRPVRPWLYGIATNLLRHHWRTEERQLRAYARTGVDPTTSLDEGESVDRLDALAQRCRLAAALASLRPAEREVLLLYAWAELSDGEIAAALSLPVGTVKSRLYRARQRLRNSIGPHDQRADGTVSASTGRHE